MFKNNFLKTQTTQLQSTLFKNNNDISNTNKHIDLIGQSNQSNQFDQSNRPNQPNQSNQNIQNDQSDQIIFAIVTHNIVDLKKLVNFMNVNNVIDKKNKYTALHHAVRIKKNDEIIEYLLDCGADPTIKQDEGKDCVDLSIEANYRYLIDKLLKNKNTELNNFSNKYNKLDHKFKDLEKNNQKLTIANEELTKINDYLTKSTNEYVMKIESLKTDNLNLKRKFDSSEKAFENLLKKTKK